MKCPTDGTQLMMSERSGIEIDYCPQCRGVWLDRGELDKIIERSGASAQRIGTERPSPTASRDDYQDSRADAQGRKRRKESWLSELFD